MCVKYSVGISATTSTNITAASSHSTNAVRTHAATTFIKTTTNNNNNNVRHIYNCNRVIVTLAVFDH